jgi:hypothetical protein
MQGTNENKRRKETKTAILNRAVSTKRRRLLLLQKQLVFERRSIEFRNQTRTNERGQIDGVLTNGNDL